MCLREVLSLTLHPSANDTRSWAPDMVVEFSPAPGDPITAFLRLPFDPGSLCTFLQPASDILFIPHLASFFGCLPVTWCGCLHTNECSVGSVTQPPHYISSKARDISITCYKSYGHNRAVTQLFSIIVVHKQVSTYLPFTHRYLRPVPAQCSHFSSLSK